MACDGLWSTVPHQQVIDLAHGLVAEGKPLNEVCKTVAEHAYNEGSTDNITVMVIKFEH